tara:strand:- start:18238 stop:19314 length:1077 start_codon:yes stop_codon:yes gene_type:complete
MLRLLLAAAFAAPIATAQDMIAVSWSGAVYALDSFAGTATLLGNGAFGQNSLARDDLGGLWSTERVGLTYSLTSIDPATGAATTVTPNFADLRAMASAGGSLLWGIEDTGADQLVKIDVTTSQVTTIGPTGYSAIQCLATLGGVMYAWDNNSGLLTIDPLTGAATDIDVTVGGNGDMQWLARRSDGKLVGGNNALYEIDILTGNAVVIGGSFPDFRGAEPYQERISNFGSGCAGAFGTVTSTAQIGNGPNAQLNCRSTNHDPNVPGLLLVGISSSQTGALPLPFNIDPVFGTQGCTLYVSLDVTVLAFTSAQSPANLDVSFPLLPAWRGYSLLLQHAVLDNVPGGLSLSDAVAVQFGF